MALNRLENEIFSIWMILSIMDWYLHFLKENLDISELGCPRIISKRGDLFSVFQLN